jgi:hypothetical protein
VIRREARALFEAAGVVLPKPALGLLVERTEGWAAGLRLAALALSLSTIWQGRLDEAEPWLDHAERTLRAEAEPAAAMHLLRLGDTARAEATLAELDEQQRETVPMRTVLAAVWLAQGNPQAAMTALAPVAMPDWSCTPGCSASRTRPKRSSRPTSWPAIRGSRSCRTASPAGARDVDISPSIRGHDWSRHDVDIWR